MKKYNRTISGFSLVELLVSITIIGILSTITIILTFSSLQRGRDARRKEDLYQIQVALQLYYQDHGSYPTTASDINKYTYNVKSTNSSQPWLGGISPRYMSTVPIDPINNRSLFYQYAYKSDNEAGCPAVGQWYALSANLENKSDPQTYINRNSLWCDGSSLKSYIDADPTFPGNYFIVFVATKN